MAETTTRSRQSNRAKDDNRATSRSSSRSGSTTKATRGRPGSRGAEPAPKNANADERKFLEKNKAGLSKTTLRAKWTHSPDEHEDRAGQTLATRSPEVIRRWAEDRGGIPATTASIPEGERPRTLRFDFPANGQTGSDLGGSERAEGGRGDRGRGNERGNDRTSGSTRGRRLRPVSWDEWLGVFQDRDLVFLYQEHRRNGGDSNFFRLDSPEREEG